MAETEKYLLDVRDLCISFGGLKAVDNFSLQIRKKELYGLIGPNGAGKTTVFNILTGVYKPDKGSILLDGKNITGMSTVDVNRAGIARTFQNIRLFDNLTVLENVKAALSSKMGYSLLESVTHLGNFRSREYQMYDRALEILKVFELDEYAGYAAGQLPYGKQRKLEIARALATGPKLLLLDEPAAGMNPQETAELMDTIRFVRDHFDMTILLIEHDMKLVSGICEEITVLNFGQILSNGDTRTVMNDPEVIRAYLGD